MTKKDKEIMNLKIRIKELETILCPLEEHEWIKSGVVSINPADPSAPYRNTYKCKRCGKVR